MQSFSEKSANARKSRRKNWVSESARSENIYLPWNKDRPICN